LSGAAAWHHYYGDSWGNMKLGQQVGAFVEGGANLIAATGLPLEFALGIIAVMVACFAATTLDTATRLQRYVIQEIGNAVRVAPLRNKYVATTIAVVTGGAIALTPGPQGAGSGGLLLWPLFGATNQLLAGLAFLVLAFYLIRHNRPVWFLAVPAFLMIVMPAWAMVLQIYGWFNLANPAAGPNWLLIGIGIMVEALQVWMLIEGLLMWNRAKGVLPEPLPPLHAAAAIETTGG
jgi:carbon starvation protein